MTDAITPGSVVAHDVLLRVSDPPDRYAIHAALDERWGRRGEVGYLWCIGAVAEGPAARVRLPAGHPDGAAGQAVLLPAEGAALRFRLRANVTRKIGISGKRASWPLAEIAPRLRWLDRRAAEHGFSLDGVDAATTRVFIRKGRGFWIDETTFTGRLTVLDPARFAGALRSGVGQRPAFGFGLLETF